MTLTEHIEPYLEAMHSKGLAGLTLRNQRSHLRRFAQYLDELGTDDVAALRREDIEEYLETLSWLPTRTGFAMKPQTRNVRLSSIKSFCQWLIHSDRIALDPAKDVGYCREPQALPRRILSVDEMRQLLAAPDSTTLLGFRDRLVLELLYSTAVRVAELRGFDVDDIDTEQGYARVRCGKGGKDRVVPVGTLACELCDSYLAEIRPALLDRRRSDSGVDALILSQYGARLGTLGINKLIRRQAKKAGLSASITAHTFRHSCATHMLRGGANVRHLQEMLGHRRVTSTEIYTRVTITDLKEAHGKFHPRARLLESEVRRSKRRKKSE